MLFSIIYILMLFVINKYCLDTDSHSSISIFFTTYIYINIYIAYIWSQYILKCYKTITKYLQFFLNIRFVICIRVYYLYYQLRSDFGHRTPLRTTIIQRAQIWNRCAVHNFKSPAHFLRSDDFYQKTLLRSSVATPQQSVAFKYP